MPSALGNPGADRGGAWLDAALALLLFAATVSYLAALPFGLGHPDEAHYLHEAKRVAAGERLYRDVFELATPGWIYLMALLFRVFGVTLATARIAAAVIHAGTAVLLFLVCRRLDVRRGLALACAATYVALSQSAWPVASQHWLVTFLNVAVLLLCLRPLGVARSLCAGLVVGLAIAVHQTRGLAMALGITVFLILDTTLLQRSGPHQSHRLWRSAIALAAGSLAVILALLAGLVVSAGFEPVWRALVVHPFESYRESFRVRWGFGGKDNAIVPVLKYGPLALLGAIPRVVNWWRPNSKPESGRAGMLLIVVGVFSIASIWYYPDYIHLAFIAPVFMVAAADAVEQLLRAIPGRRQTALGWAISLIIIGATVHQLGERMVQLTPGPTDRYESAFGPVDMNPNLHATYDKLRRLLNDVPSRTLYCHPLASYNYLLLDAHNPTRFEFVLPKYNTPEQVDEVIRVLRTTDVPYVRIDPRRAHRRDPITVFIHQHYEPVADDMLRNWGLWQRRRPMPDGTPPGG